MYASALWLWMVGCGTEAGPRGPAGPEGPRGEAGAPGAPGQDFDAGPRLYGSGADGDLVTKSGSETFESGREYANITIPSDSELLVRSGTVIRCTGIFENDGRVVVLPAARSGIRAWNSPSAEFPMISPPAAGVALSPAGFGSRDDSEPFVAVGGLGGRGIATGARELVRPLAAVGGAGTVPWPFNAGGYDSGGGSVHIRCAGEIRNRGEILAEGSGGLTSLTGNEGSGGGGGAVLLASATGIDGGGGLISVAGGDGADGSGQLGGSGGGGGGFVHLVAPTIESGTVDVSGGEGGLSTDYSSAVRAIGGSGGGGSAGSGGRGQGTESAAGDGGAGVVFVIEKDPAVVL